jgi:curved DNA-binding protein CbpA
VEDLYKRLQVDPLAESEVIRAAYHALARKYHPDAGGETRRMVEFNEAWAILKDPLLRSAYDTERARPVAPPATPTRANPAPPGPAAPAGPPRSSTDKSTVVDFGRYAGWSLVQIVKNDPNYLEWLVRTPIGRRLSPEVEALLELRTGVGGPLGAGRRVAETGASAPRHRGRGSNGRQWFGLVTQSR